MIEFTPAGAKVTIRRSKKHSNIEIDRWEISDANHDQQDAVRALFEAEHEAYFADRVAKATVLSGPSLWAGTTTRSREQEVLDRLIRIEAGVFS